MAKMDWAASWNDIGTLRTHRGYIDQAKVLNHAGLLKIGSVATFAYTNQFQEPGKTQYRLVFVLNPYWVDLPDSKSQIKSDKPKCHALELRNISRHTLLTEILPHLGMVHTPKLFYETVIKQNHVYNLEAYRTYLVSHMQDVVQFHYDITEDKPKTVEETLLNDKFLNEHSDAAIMRKYFEQEIKKLTKSDSEIMRKYFLEG